MKAHKGKSDCAHHWVIDSPRRGRRTWGRCRKCPAARLFRSAWVERRGYNAALEK